MILLSSTSNSKVTFVMAPNNYTGLYNRLKAIMPQHYSLFAKPKVTGRNTNWYWEGETMAGTKPIVKNFDALTSEEMEEVSGYLEDVKPLIIDALINDQELKGYVMDFFQLPGKDDIKVVVGNNSFKKVVLTQWGCKLNNQLIQVDPIATIIDIPKPNRDEVIVNVVYKDGGIAAGRMIYIDYQGIENSGKTDKEGCKSFGKFRYGSKICVFDKVNEQRCCVHEFVVEKGKQYQVVLPYIIQGAIKVIDQRKMFVPNCELSFLMCGKQWDGNTDEFGRIELNDLQAGELLLAKELLKPDNQKEYTLSRERNDFVFEIIRAYFSDVKITVLDQFDSVVPNEELVIHFIRDKNEKLEVSSDESGCICLDQILEGSKLKVDEKKNPEHFEEYIIKENGNDFVFRIEIPVPRDIKIRILDEKKNPASNQAVVLKHKEKQYELITDNEGYVEISLLEINDGDCISVRLKVEKRRKIRKLQWLRK